MSFCILHCFYCCFFFDLVYMQIATQLKPSYCRLSYQGPTELHNNLFNFRKRLPVNGSIFKYYSWDRCNEVQITVGWTKYEQVTCRKAVRICTSNNGLLRFSTSIQNCGYVILPCVSYYRCTNSHSGVDVFEVWSFARQLLLSRQGDNPNMGTKC